MTTFPVENPGGPVNEIRGPAAGTEAPKTTEAPAPGSPAPGSTPGSAPGSTNSSPNGSRAASGAAAASSWRAVDQALLARDDARAQRALNGLATSGDPTTRAKAELGLAQLAQGRGDCAEARRHALAARAVSGADPAVLRRAETLAQNCR
jgi:hypothetical protein